MSENPSARLPSLSLDVADSGETVRIDVRGELDLSNADKLREALLAPIPPGRRLLLDLSMLNFMDSTGIRTRMEADAAARTMVTR